MPDLEIVNGSMPYSPWSMFILYHNTISFVDTGCALPCGCASTMDAECEAVQASTCKTKTTFTGNDMDLDSGQKISLEPPSLSSRHMETRYPT
jgi:hypothetical protein